MNLLKQEALPDITDTISISLKIASITKVTEELLFQGQSSQRKRFKNC